MNPLLIYSVRRSSNLISEYFDDEVIIANLLEGMYYSLQSVAADLWKLLEKEATVDQLTAFVHHHYTTDGIDVKTDITDFIQQLNTHELLTETTSISPEFDIVTATIKKPYTKPEVGVHDDMKDLLALDPIHDVDSVAGWPIQK